MSHNETPATPVSQGITEILFSTARLDDRKHNHWLVFIGNFFAS